MASKLTRLPPEIRLELNQRLRNNQTGPEILPWLNALESTQAVLAQFYDGVPISPANLSLYREGEYAVWLERQEQVEHTASLAEQAHALAAASGHGLSQGMLAILVGRLLEAMDDPTADAEQVSLLLKNFPKLSNEEVKHQRLGLQRQLLEARKEERELKKEALAQQRQKLEMLAVEKFWEWHATTEVQAILAKPQTPARMADLRRILFGDRDARRDANANANANHHARETL